jgi:hypothetical protein
LRGEHGVELHVGIHLQRVHERLEGPVLIRHAAATNDPRVHVRSGQGDLPAFGFTGVDRAEQDPFGFVELGLEVDIERLSDHFARGAVARIVRRA